MSRLQGSGPFQKREARHSRQASPSLGLCRMLDEHPTPSQTLPLNFLRLCSFPIVGNGHVSRCTISRRQHRYSRTQRAFALMRTNSMRKPEALAFDMIEVEAQALCRIYLVVCSVCAATRRRPPHRKPAQGRAVRALRVPLAPPLSLLLLTLSIVAWQHVVSQFDCGAPAGDTSSWSL
jgi:hypothetical protein